MSTGEWIQIAVAGVLAATLLAVVYYACQAKRQADAGAEMAREMQRARRDAVRPVIEVASNEERARALIKQAQNKTFPPEVGCRLRNIGVGPALNIQFHVHHSQEQRPVPFKMGALAAGESDGRYHHLSVEMSQGGGDLRLLRVRYQDVFGNTLESSRELSLNEDGELLIGPLQTAVREGGSE